MEFTAKQIAEHLHGRVDGCESTSVHTFAKIEEAKEGSITFLANPAYEHYIYTTQASIVLVNKDFEPKQEVKATMIRVDNPYECIAALLTLYEQSKPRPKGISSLAFVAPSAKIGKDVYLAPFVSVGEHAEIGDGVQLYPHVSIGDNVKIGQKTILYSNVSVYHDCIIGSNCILHAGCVVGADGFGFAPTAEGYEKIPQIGIVTIEDDVEIGANTCVDRSTMGTTLIKKGVKLDNLVQIAHNVVIGDNTVMSAQVGVAGSTKIGQWCMFGGQVGIAGHISIGNKVFLGAQSGAPGSIKDDQTLIGTPPMNPKGYFRSQAIFRRLPEMYKQLNELQKEIEELKNKNK